ncbi:MAG: IS200/IS605 family transposase [Blastocatellia bacterium]
MNPANPLFQDLPSAYQLHYYICVRSKFNQPIFTPTMRADFEPHLESICRQYGYNPLRWKVYENQFRVLLSLRPEHQVSDVVGRLKGNLSRLLRREHQGLTAGNIWSRGYLAKSTGKIDEATVLAYIANQAIHHGYSGGAESLVCAYDAMTTIPELWHHNHATFKLSHHLVFETQHHKDVFDDATGTALIAYWLRVAKKKRFEIGQIRLLPNHAHLFVCLFPTMSVLECVCALMNNSWAMMSNRYAGVLKQTDAWDLWEGSFYAGSTGDVTTAQLKKYLESDAL